MSKQRMVNTKFWDDDYTSNLDPIEKLLFLYFLTNTSTNISGIYEIPLKKIAMETGIDKEMVSKIIERFAEDGKVFYHNGWLCMRNFVKNQNQRSPKVMIGIKNELEAIPKDIMDIFVGYGYPIASNLIKSNLIQSNLTESNIGTAVQDINKKIPKVIDLFCLINDNYKNFFANKTERKVVKELLEKYSEEKIEKYIYLAKFSFNNQFFPSFISPFELQKKWSKIDKFWATKNVEDKRYIQEFDRYYLEEIKKKVDPPPEKELETRLFGKKFNFKFNGN